MNREQQTVSMKDGTRLSVRVYSGGVPSPSQNVVLLHGWPNSGKIWEPFAEELLRMDHSLRLFAPTFRGFGDSEATDTGYTCASFADDICDIISQLNLEDVVVVGHSMGGKIAQLIATRHPVWLKSLILLSPAFAPAANVPLERRESQKRAFGDPLEIKNLCLGMVSQTLPEASLALLTHDGLATSQVAFDAWIDTMREEDFTDNVPLIDVPTLVLHGENDPLRTLETIDVNVVKRIPGSQLTVLPGVGHLAHLEAPRTLAVTVLPFLRGYQKSEELGFIAHFPGMPEAINSDSFDEDVLLSPIPVVVEFWASRCGPCRRMAPDFAAVANSLGKAAKFFCLNVDEELEAAERFNVLAIPAILLFVDGEEKKRIVGPIDRSVLVEFIRPFLAQNTQE